MASASASPASQPRQASFPCQGVATDMVLCEYDDRTAVFVSQGGRLGTIMLVTRQGTRGGGGGAEPAPNVNGAMALAGGGAASTAGRGDGAGSGATDPAAAPGAGAWEDEEEDELGWPGAGAAASAPREVFSVSVLLGRRDEPLLVACARSIAEGLSALGSSKALFLTLGLNPQHHTLAHLRDVSQKVVAFWGERP